MSVQQISIPLQPGDCKLDIPEGHVIRNLLTSEIVGKTDFDSKRFIVLREVSYQSEGIFCRSVFFKGDTHSILIATVFINRMDGQCKFLFPNNVSPPANLDLILTLELEENQ